MARVEAFDRVVDDAFSRYLRGRRAVDGLMYSASALGDHGILWLSLAGVQSLRRREAGERGWRSFVRLGIGIGVESAIINGPVKMMFRRTRPVGGPASTWYLRQPRTSSFPSGHATSAFCAAALLRDGDGLWPLYYAAALLVAASRVHVRIHHASDVAAGIVIGAALGELARRLAPLDNGTPQARGEDATPRR